MKLNLLLCGLSVCACLCSPASAGDWYVDAVIGSDANSGTSPASAWRSITWAVGNVPLGAAETIHVAPGTYDGAGGESFPIRPRPGQEIIGAGPFATVVRGPTTGALFLFDASPSGWAFGPDSLLAALRLTDATEGVWIHSTWSAADPTLADLEIDAITDAGVIVTAGSGGFPGQYLGSAAPTLRSVRARGCGRGLVVNGRHLAVTVEDSEFSANTQSGLSLYSADPVPLAFACARTRFDGNGLHGASADFLGSGRVDASFEDCSLSGNVHDGWSCVPRAGTGGGRDGVFRRCTLAHNLGRGCFGQPMAGQLDSLALHESIVWGNADDIDFASGPLAASDCDVDEPGLVGSSGNFAAPPLFVAAAAGDFRLTFGSPCVDAVPNPVPAGSLDLLGRAREVDGDLDTSARSDLGASEFRPLNQSGTARIGTPLELECWGPAGAVTTIYFSRTGLAAFPQSTPFGSFALDPAQYGAFRRTTSAPGPPRLVVRDIPDQAGLVGRTFSFQALTRSSAAPAGAAYTNPVSITILP